jgi:hypothetical protein
MSQNDMTIADADGATVRADINDALQAITSNNSGATEPTTKFAFQWWADTTTGLLKLRNAGNSAWVTLLDYTKQLAAKYTNVNAQTGTTYTTVLTDDDKLVTLSNALAIALTIPTNASVAYPIGTTIAFQQIGAGLVTMSGSGVTLNSRNGLVSGGQYAGWSITKTATNTWAVFGDLTT